MSSEFLVVAEYWANTSSHGKIALCHQVNIPREKIPAPGEKMLLRHYGQKRTHNATVTKVVYDTQRQVYKVFLSHTHNVNTSLNYSCVSLDVPEEHREDIHRTHGLTHWIEQL